MWKTHTNSLHAVTRHIFPMSKNKWQNCTERNYFFIHNLCAEQFEWILCGKNWNWHILTTVCEWFIALIESHFSNNNEYRILSRFLWSRCQTVWIVRGIFVCKTSAINKKLRAYNSIDYFVWKPNCFATEWSAKVSLTEIAAQTEVTS